MEKKSNRTAAAYSAVTILMTFLTGQIILWKYPDGSNRMASVLFILMNLFPMIIACIFSCAAHETDGIKDFLKKVFAQKERSLPYIGAVCVVTAYYGISALLGNVNYTGAAFTAVLLYLPWTVLQGGLEEVGWRWYLQSHICLKNDFILKMFLISLVWFVWHFPIYRLPWITAGSADYRIFYLMILGNTFMLGAVREMSKGAVPCILAHMFIDTLAVVMTVQSSFDKIAVLAAAEIALSLLAVTIYRRKH